MTNGNTWSIIQWFWMPDWKIVVVAVRALVTVLIYFSLQASNRSKKTDTEEGRQVHGAIIHTCMHTRTHRDISIQHKPLTWRSTKNSRNSKFSSCLTYLKTERQVLVHKVKLNTSKMFMLLLFLHFYNIEELFMYRNRNAEKGCAPPFVLQKYPQVLVNIVWNITQCDCGVHHISIGRSSLGNIICGNYGGSIS